jgi:hypothetical protein
MVLLVSDDMATGFHYVQQSEAEYSDPIQGIQDVQWREMIKTISPIELRKASRIEQFPSGVGPPLDSFFFSER